MTHPVFDDARCIGQSISISSKFFLDMDFLFESCRFRQVGNPVFMDECQIYPAGSGTIKFA